MENPAPANGIARGGAQLLDIAGGRQPETGTLRPFSLYAPAKRTADPSNTTDTEAQANERRSCRTRRSEIDHFLEY